MPATTFPPKKKNKPKKPNPKKPKPNKTQTNLNPTNLLAGCNERLVIFFSPLK